MTRYTMTEITQEADAWPESLEDTFFVRGAMLRQLLVDHAVMKEALDGAKSALEEDSNDSSRSFDRRARAWDIITKALTEVTK